MNERIRCPDFNGRRSRKDYMREYMRQYRREESESLAEKRREKSKISQRKKRKNMNEDEKRTVLEKERLGKIKRRNDISNELYLKNIQNERFQYKIRINSMDAGKLLDKREKDSERSRRYRKDIRSESTNKYNLDRYSSFRKPLRLFWKRDSERKRLHNYILESRPHWKKANIMGFYPIDINNDMALEPFLSYLIMKNFFQNKFDKSELYGKWERREQIKENGVMIGTKYVVSCEYHRLPLREGNPQYYFKEENKQKARLGTYRNFLSSIVWAKEEIRLIDRLSRARDMNFVPPTMYYTPDKINGIEPFLRYLERNKFDLFWK